MDIWPEEANKLLKTMFLAKVASFTDDGYCTLLSFTDDPDNPVNYLMLDMTNEPDEQDLRLGLGGIHIDACALRLDGDDLVQDILETDAGLVVSLTADAARKAGIGQEIEIELGSKVIDGFAVSEAVRRFRQRLWQGGER